MGGGEEDIGVTGGGEVFIIAQKGVFFIRIHKERAGAARLQTFTKLLERRRHEAVRPPHFEL